VVAVGAAVITVEPVGLEPSTRWLRLTVLVVPAVTAPLQRS
jgi:hypothetical protein